MRAHIRFSSFLILFACLACTPAEIATQPPGPTSTPVSATPTHAPQPTETPQPTASATVAPIPTEPEVRLPDLVPPGALARIGRGAITALAAGPDFLAIGSSIGVCLYDLPGLEERWCASTQRPVTSLAVSPGGERLAAGLTEGYLLLWDLPSRTELANRRIGLYEGPYSLAFSPDGSQLVAVEAGNLSLWDGLTLEEGESLSTTPSPFGQAAFSPDGRYLAWIDHPTSRQFLRIRDLAAGETIGNPELPFWSHSLAWTPDSGTLVVGLAGDIGCYENCTPTYTTAGGLIYYELQTQEIRQTSFDLQDQAVYALRLSPDGSEIALWLGAYFPQIVVTDLTDPQFTPLPAPEAPSEQSLHPYSRLMAWSPDGRSLYYLQADGGLGRWEAGAETVEPVTPAGYGLQVWVQSLARAGGLIAKFLSHPVNRLSIRTLPDDETLVDLPLPQYALEAIRWDPAGRRLALGGYPGLQIFDLETQEIRTLLEPAPDEYFLCCEWSPDGLLLVAGSVNWLDEDTFVEKILILDVSSGELISVIEGAGPIFAISPDGSRIAVHRWSTEGASAVLSIWSLPGGKWISDIELSFGLYNFAWSPDGGSIVAFQDHSIVRIEPFSGEFLWSRNHSPLHADWIGSSLITFSPAGRWVITAGREVALWDPETGELAHVFEGHTGLIRSMSITPDGTRLVTASEDGTVIIWELP